MAEILTFLPGTMCDQRLWAPVWQRLSPRFSTVIMSPIETQPTRAGHARPDSIRPHPSAIRFISSRSPWAAIWRWNMPLANPGRVASLVTVGSSAFGLTDEEKAERVRALAMLEKHDYRGMPTAGSTSSSTPRARRTPRWST